MQSFRDRVVVITGAASGIGRALACAFAKAGARLALADVDAAGLAETARLAAASDCLTQIVDVANRAASSASPSKWARASASRMW